MSQTTRLPLVTIGVVSFNRLKYLRALMESARECIQYPNIQWIIVDGNSRETGLREYIESLDFVQHKIFKDCTHAEAMNTIVSLAQGQNILMVPEDVQFIVKGRWLEDLVDVTAKNPRIGNVVFNYQRRSRIQHDFGKAFLHLRWGRHRRFLQMPFRRRVPVYRSASGMEFLGFGNLREGICGSGIMSFSRTEVWKKLGPWRATNAKVGNDSSLGAEDDMVLRYFESGMSLENVMMRYCVAADIVTDMSGSKARVRGGNKRYGTYLTAPQGTIYYRIREQSELIRFADRLPAPGFEDVVEAIGYELPFDAQGNLLKSSTIDMSKPYEPIS